MSVPRPIFLLAADALAVSTSEKTVAGVLGAAVVGLSVYLILRHHGRSAPPDNDPNRVPSLTEGSGWRVPVAVTMGLCGVLVFLGILIDPKAHPAIFVYYWSLLALVVFILVPIAAYDMLIMRKRAYRERIRLLEENRAQIQRDLLEMRRRARAAAAEGDGKLRHERDPET